MKKKNPINISEKSRTRNTLRSASYGDVPRYIELSKYIWEETPEFFDALGFRICRTTKDDKE